MYIFSLGKLHFYKIIKEKGRENCYLSEITILELRFGAENSGNPSKSHKAVDKFVSGLHIIPIFGSVKQYAKEKCVLGKWGSR